MNTDSPDPKQNTKTAHTLESPLCVFDDLRRRLSRETPSRALSDLMESVNAMQRARDIPEQFDLRFEEFVYRAEDYTGAVRPFFPRLVKFLSSRARSEGGPGKRDASASGVPARVA